MPGRPSQKICEHPPPKKNVGCEFGSDAGKGEEMTDRSKNFFVIYGGPRKPKIPLSTPPFIEEDGGRKNVEKCLIWQAGRGKIIPH